MVDCNCGKCERVEAKLGIERARAQGQGIALMLAKERMDELEAMLMHVEDYFPGPYEQWNKYKEKWGVTQ